ncbi:hypothetical protein NPIL_444901 [Nephila pilipes]|uniref:Uncharacterized protein n=1 Tax=Nephila pilipes TaxID=299642 RepID=A0A8X6P644_NEPPI|nr:hypothetical protein NPIL_444901 [Nephila pilipes]
MILASKGHKGYVLEALKGEASSRKGGGKEPGLLDNPLDPDTSLSGKLTRLEEPQPTLPGAFFPKDPVLAFPSSPTGRFNAPDPDNLDELASSRE